MDLTVLRAKAVLVLLFCIGVVWIASVVNQWRK